jgi:hypothetical protein
MTHAGKSSSTVLGRIRAEPGFVLDAERRCLSEGLDGVVLDGVVVGNVRCAGVGGLLDLEGVTAAGVFSALWRRWWLGWPSTLERYWKTFLYVRWGQGGRGFMSGRSSFRFNLFRPSATPSASSGTSKVGRYIQQKNCYEDAKNIPFTGNIGANIAPGNLLVRLQARRFTPRLSEERRRQLEELGREGAAAERGEEAEEVAFGGGSVHLCWFMVWD